MKVAWNMYEGEHVYSTERIYMFLARCSTMCKEVRFKHQRCAVKQDENVYLPKMGRMGAYLFSMSAPLVGCALPNKNKKEKKKEKVGRANLVPPASAGSICQQTNSNRLCVHGDSQPSQVCCLWPGRMNVSAHRRLKTGAGWEFLQRIRALVWTEEVAAVVWKQPGSGSPPSISGRCL